MFLFWIQQVSTFDSIANLTTTWLLCIDLSYSSVAAIGFAQTQYTVLESAGIQTVCVQQTSPIPVSFDRNVLLTLNTADMTATGK